MPCGKEGPTLGNDGAHLPGKQRMLAKGAEMTLTSTFKRNTLERQKEPLLTHSTFTSLSSTCKLPNKPATYDMQCKNSFQAI